MRPRFITDQNLLDWIVAGELRITHTTTRRPRLIFRGRRMKAELVTHRGRNYPPDGCARYTWRLCDGRTRRGKLRRRRVVCAKLVWIFCHRRLPPYGWFIHHDDEDRHNDAIGNLFCLDDDTHKAAHYSGHFEREEF